MPRPGTSPPHTSCSTTRRWERCWKISRARPLIRPSNPARQDKRVAAADYLNLLKHAARNGLALGVFGKGPDNTHVVVVIRKGNRPEIARLLESLAAAGPGQPEQKPEPAQKSGRTLHALGTDGVWWVEKDDLILIDNDVVRYDRGRHRWQAAQRGEPSAARGLDPAEGRL